FLSIVPDNLASPAEIKSTPKGPWPIGTRLASGASRRQLHRRCVMSTIRLKPRIFPAFASPRSRAGGRTVSIDGSGQPRALRHYSVNLMLCRVAANRRDVWPAMVGGLMTRVQIAMHMAAVGSIAGACLAAAPPAEGAAALAPHRAVYDLSLAKSRGGQPIEAIHGRILYDFSGNACEGYALQFRQVSEIDRGVGKVALSDLRAATWEEGEAKSFRFNSENKVNERVVDTVDGNAGRDSSGVSVKLAKPQPKNFDLDAKIVFPTEHVRRVIEAAEAGKTF